MAVKYEYKCPECGKMFERDTTEGELWCAVAGEGSHNELTKRVYSLGGITFKGSGFYKNDK